MSEDSIEVPEKISTEDGYEPNLLEILTYPNDVLHSKSDPLDEKDFNSEWLKTLITDMFYTMRVKNGIGLSAIQTGLSLRIVVMMLEEPLVIINPKLVAVDGEMEFEEGCLSVPGYFENRTRYESIRVAYFDEEGTPKELSAKGLTAFCIQHELDHLDGKLFVDDLSALKKMRVKKKVQKTIKQNT